MSRVLALLLLFVMAVPASGAVTLLEAACEEDCGDSGDAGDCCACLCNIRSVALLTSRVTRPASDQPVVRPPIGRADEAPPDPEPAEILHIPKRAV
jgi:hypothetical protein